MIKRKLQKNIAERFFKGKVIIITGARQVGKTTLLNMLTEGEQNNSVYLNCDEPDIRSLLTDATSTKLKSIVGSKKFILIDEAQRVKNIGITLKLFVDQLKERQVIVTGSSALELSNEISEPLTGRKYEFNLYPFSWSELVDANGYIETNRLLEERILYGMYPEITQTTNNKKELLKNLAESYLFKDVLAFKDLRKPELLEKLIKSLALQIGNQVSYHELSKSLKVDNETIARYIELLEKAFVIFRLSPYSRNLRSEITRMRKVYFFDTGIRNVLINNFNPLELRQDTGALWENFLISEKLKNNKNGNKDVNMYFWRTQQKQEIDYLEEYNNQLFAYELKWSSKSKKIIPKTFLNAYPNSTAQFIDKENFNTFLEM